MTPRACVTRKTWADGTHEDTAYNALNFKSTLTDARGVVTTWGYNLKKGVNNSVSYSDSTPGIQYAYNHLNQLTQVTDASGSRVLTYTPYNEPDTDSHYHRKESPASSRNTTTLTDAPPAIP